ncbi:MAG TPA: hypothetical protein VM223_09790 [Planctomycetota bacterium]|nr:hypothetical protein [Planctomycetota bacterium]
MDRVDVVDVVDEVDEVDRNGPNGECSREYVLAPPRAVNTSR